MTDFLNSGVALLVGTLVLVAGTVVGLLVLMLPAQPKVSLARRRPLDAAAGTGGSTLGSLAEVATTSITRILRGRSGGFAGMLERAGIRTPLAELIVVVGAATLAAFAVGMVLGGGFAVGGLVRGLLFAIAVPILARVFLEFKISSRRNRFGNQMEETLQIIAGSLRAGYSLPQAISTVAVETEAPASEEFTRVVNETRVGRPLVEALEEAAARVHNEDFYWVTQAIAINREVGGNLADVLDGVGKTIRQRGELRRQVKSLSAEGKLSAIILGVLPFVLLLLVSVANPGYLSLLYTNPIGIAMSVVGCVLLISGIFWLRNTVKIKF